VAYLGWDATGESLVYALYTGLAEEPGSWKWWSYHLSTGERVQLPSPGSQVDDAARQRLGLCSLTEVTVTRIEACAATSSLFESPVTDRIVFSPLSAAVEGGELWLANKDGSDAQKMGDFAPTYVHWSPEESWLVVGRHIPALPGQEEDYLVAADGSYLQQLSEITGHDDFQINGLFPEFSPDGRSLAYVGSETPMSLNENDYNLYLLDLDTLESRLISERFGMFQWAADGQGLYVLDGAVFFPGENVFNTREVSLYYIDLSQNVSSESLIANLITYHPDNSYGTWNWAYSPDTQAIAYVGFKPNELGILVVTPP
jgi:hypothetical protein